MINAILKMLEGLTHKELVKLRGFLNTSIHYRESLEPIAWECPGCNFSAPSWAEVVNHAQQEHSFEDTGKGYGVAYPPREVWS